MFYGAFVLAKKGPLAKVWLAAHWDKKLTKAHVFETDVESTVDSIISPQVKLALRTSGHLLLGVVRIYSRKQKYLINDLGEACAKIKMAFRPGIVDLPAEGGVASSEAITLPEIFHDFETAVADIGSMDVEMHTVHPGRASEITLPEQHTTTGGDLFNAEFGELGGFEGEGFGGGMAEIELNRRSKSSAFADKPPTDRTELAVSDMSNGLALDEAGQKRPGHTLEENRLPGRMDAAEGMEFIGEGFGEGGMVDLGALPNVSDLTLDGSKKQYPADEVPMDVDQPPGEGAPGDQPAAAGDQANQGGGPEEGFVLEPVETTTVVTSTSSREKKSKRKRKLIVDASKELTSDFIKKMLSDYEDTLQGKCFPPPTKKAVLWRTMASSDQLFANPTMPFMADELCHLVNRNYVYTPPEGQQENDGLDDLAAFRDEATKDANATAEIENLREKTEVEGDGDITVGEGARTDVVGADTRDPSDLAGLEFVMDEFGQGVQDLGGAGGLSDMLDEGEGTRFIPDLPDLGGDGTSIVQSSEDQQQNSDEPSEEFERRRWTRRTQQVFRVLDKGLSSHNDVKFSSLTQRCNRKQAASRFYTCLLLAKEGAISVNQPAPYSDITIKKGPKFASAF